MAPSATSPSSSLLERLHPELVDLVVAELGNVADISALRLTCRTLAARVVESPALRKHIAHKTIELTNRSLSAFVTITAPGSVPGQLLQNVTLKGIARNKLAVYMGRYSSLPPSQVPGEDPEQDQDTMLLNTPEEDPHDHIRLLTQAFMNLRQNGRKGTLASLSLIIGPSTHPRAVYVVPRHKRGVGNFPHEVEAGTGRARSTKMGTGSTGDSDEEDYVSAYEIPYRPSWRAVWDAAEKTFDVATQALAASQLQLTDEFNVFRNLMGCAIPFDVFLRFIRKTISVRGANGHTDGAKSAVTTTSDKEEEANAEWTSAYPLLKRLKIRLSLRHRSAANEWKAEVEAEERQARDAETDGVDEFLTISRLQAEFDASHQAQINAERGAVERILQTIIAPGELARIMPALEEIDVGWYCVGRNMVAPADAELRPRASLTDDSAEQRPLSRLRSLGLHGLRLEGGAFLRFLDKARPEHLTLCYPQFASGTFEPLLRYLTDPALQINPDTTRDMKELEPLAKIEDIHPILAPLLPSPVRSFELDDIMDGYALIHYDVPGQPKFRYLDLPDLGPCTLVRPESATALDLSWLQNHAEAVDVEDTTGPDTAEEKAPPELIERPPGGVKMIRPTTRPMGSGNRWRWARLNGNMYGPPRARYDLPDLNPGMIPLSCPRPAYFKPPQDPVWQV
ncbi:hypothetical protein SBRCBS47491_009395 [Sporothrix bragantina]|uniref:F-box domain-containing protein n=1 Tax=Sporothrix bragantina TaxID=671064 RepID=A0ABP0CXK3_9PEZI